jgi:hypothetical protein
MLCALLVERLAVGARLGEVVVKSSALLFEAGELFIPLFLK